MKARPTDAIADYASQVAVVGGNRICLKLRMAFIATEQFAKLGGKRAKLSVALIIVCLDFARPLSSVVV